MKRMFTSFVSGATRMFAVLVLLIVVSINASAQNVSVTATAGTLGPTLYTTLQAAFNAINIGTHQGAINITISGTGTFETATAVLNQTGGPAVYTSVTIKPAAGATPTISGSFNAALIHLFGASNVTFDGSNTVGGLTRDLTITNTFAGFGGTTACIRLGSNAAVGVSNITVKNCKLTNGAAGVGICLTSGSGTVIFGQGTAPHTNVVIKNNAFTSGQLAIYGYGPAAPALDNNWTIDSNDCINHGFSGIQLNNNSTFTIERNNISNVTVNGTARITGITLSFTGTNGVIRNNKISGITHTLAGYGVDGIYLNLSAGSSVDVYNNFVASVNGVGSPTIALNAHGILVDGVASPTNIYHNSVNMNTLSTGTPIDGCIGFTAAVALASVNLKDNIFVNTQSSTNSYGIYSSAPSTIFSSIDYNDYYATSTYLGNIGATNCTTIGQIQTNFGSNVSSISFLPAFVSGTNLHLQLIGSNSALAVGTPITTPAITTDIDAASRSAVTPTLGAHELNSKITYTALPNSCSSGNDTLYSVLIESPTGIPTTGTFIPRIYFRKGAGAWQSTGGIQMSGSSTTGLWKFVIDVTMLGGVTAGDVIQYFVIAQTTGGTVFANPASGWVATDVNTVVTPPSPLNSFVINAVTLTGLTTSQSVCFNPAGPVTLPYAYTGSTGSPNQYSLTWLPAGPTPVPSFVGLPASPINVNVPTATIPIGYTGTLTIRNSANSCTATYYITLTVNPTPATISGSTTVCQGTPSTLTSTSAGGTWTSSSPAIATVSGSGPTTAVVNGLTGGTTNIVYTLPTGCNTFASITVIDSAVAISGPSAVCLNDTMTVWDLTPGGTWSSSNPGVASIDPLTGVVTGNFPGTATIMYTLSVCAPRTKVIAVNPLPNNITGTLHVCEGFTDTLHTTSTGGTWVSGNTSVATIGSTSGVYLGVGGGTAIISYKFTSTGCVSTNTVDVYPAPGPILGGPLVCQGLSINLTNSLPGGTWSSSLPGVVLINATTGVATGLASAGVSTITYTSPYGCFVTTPIHISTPPTTITGSSNVCSGYSITLVNGTPGGTWSTADPTIATVNMYTGVVTGVAGGTVNISYSTPACNAAVYSVTVKQTPPPITGTINLCNGGPTTTVYNATPGGVWTLSGPAHISTTGVVTGLSVGATNIVTYTVPNGCFAYAPIITDTLPAPITGITNICPGRSDTLHTAATGGVWSSHDVLIASIVDTNGVISGVANGTTTVTYTAVSGCYRTRPFTVDNPLPASVTITRNPSMDTLCDGVPVVFTATPVNGGAAPTYQWQNFGVDIPYGISDTLNYNPTHGDVISVFMTNSLDICAAPVPAYASMPINVYPNVSPILTISSSTTNPIIGYLGQVVTFYATLTSGGPHPSYQWYVDSDPIPGATSNTFSRAVYDNDTVYCVVHGDAPCESASGTQSNSIIFQADYLTTKEIDANGLALTLFPNPNGGSFNISGSTGTKANETLTVEVINMLGQTVYHSTTSARSGQVNYKVALGNIAAGTYVLRVTGDTGNKVFHFVIGN